MAALTVLMPVYNASRFLAAAIESILQQTFTDFDFIIIDDASTDDSVSIITSYSDPRIRFYQNEENSGISVTLNRGIEMAETELIARMDADDISYPERLQRQYEFIQANPGGALYSCWVRVIGMANEFIRQDNFNSKYYYYNLVFICWIYHPTIVFFKSAVESVGKYNVRYSEDFELFWQLSRRYKIFNLSEVLLDYRVTDQSLHQALKKEEYEDAQYIQIKRNLQYYAGAKYILPKSFVQCLQHNFEPLLKEGKVSNIVACIKELDFLTQKIIEKDNVNRDVDSIQKAAFFKRKFIIDFFADNLTVSKGLLLLLKLKEFKFIERRFKNSVKRLLFKTRR